MNNDVYCSGCSKIVVTEEATDWHNIDAGASKTFRCAECFKKLIEEQQKNLNSQGATE